MSSNELLTDPWGIAGRSIVPDLRSGLLPHRLGDGGEQVVR